MQSRRVLIFFLANMPIIQVSPTHNFVERKNANSSYVVEKEWPVKVAECFKQPVILECFLILLENESKNSKNFDLPSLPKIMDKWRNVTEAHFKTELWELLRQKKDLDFIFKRRTAEEYFVEERKISRKTMMRRWIPLMLVPGLLLAGIMPWVMPQIKMIVMVVGFMNQMAFTTALFTLIRSYVFDNSPNENIFYVNHGYKNEKLQYDGPHGFGGLKSYS